MISILSWNVQGCLYWGTSTSFKKVLPNLLDSQPDIICLQEMCDAQVKLGLEFKKFKVYIPKLNNSKDYNKKNFNYNVILSKYPFQYVEEFVFPQSLNTTCIFENAIKAEINIDSKNLRIYNCHFMIDGVGIKTRIEQLKYILDDCKDFTGPIIICGDLNVTIPKVGWRRKLVQFVHQEPVKELYIRDDYIYDDERIIFNKIATEEGFKEAFDLNTATWSPLKNKHWEILGLKLDWFLTKNLLINSKSLGNYISDHRAIYINIVK